MIVVDSSALLAILLKEPNCDDLLQTISADASPHLSAAHYVEVAVVLLAKGDDPTKADFDRLIERLGLELTEVTRHQAEIAAVAYERYGKGRHPAALNFGDGFAYALTKALEAPLLFKGTDFSRTDIETVELGAI